MDPKATLDELQKALDLFDTDTAIDYAHYFLDWVRSGGFIPEHKMIVPPPPMVCPFYLWNYLDEINHRLLK